MNRRQHRVRVEVVIRRPVFLDVWCGDDEDPCDLTPGDKAEAMDLADISHADEVDIGRVECSR